MIKSQSDVDLRKRHQITFAKAKVLENLRKTVSSSKKGTVTFQGRPVKTTADISKEINNNEDNVGRYLKSFESKGWVRRIENGWHLTDSGMEVSEYASSFLNCVDICLNEGIEKGLLEKELITISLLISPELFSKDKK